MSSSGNRFAPLGETSSPNEKETPVPTTDTTVQAMQDVSQAGSSTEMSSFSMSDLRASLPSSSETPSLSMSDRRASLPKDHAGRVEYVRRRFAEVEAELKREKLQQSNASKGITRPLPSAAPSQLLRKRTASCNEAEEPRKRQRLGSYSRSQTVQEVPVTAPTTESDSETEEPNDGREQNPASAMDVQEDPYLSQPSSFEWRNIRMPKHPLLCIVQVNNSTRIGSFDKNTKDWAFKLTFDAGCGQIPTMTMKFFSNGIKGPQSAQTGWCLGDWLSPDWMVTDFKVHRVADCAEKSQIRHPYVLGRCKTDAEKARLICISLKAWPKILGHFDQNNRWKNPQPGVKKLFSAVLTGRHAYHLRIWFLAPNDLESFERQCLSIFTLFFQQRKPNYDGIRDAHGVGFNL